uniref:Uncharacterized protein n=1 Tax=Rhizophora mucronata TaxID=61149 RepID=A0A2P2N8F0_RHIMU
MMLLVYPRRNIHYFLSLSSLYDHHHHHPLSHHLHNINSFGELGFAVCGPPGRFLFDILIVLSRLKLTT